MAKQRSTNGEAASDGPCAAECDINSLVLEHYAYVYRYAYRLTGSVADAEDITQQTFLLAQKQLGQLERKENAKAWLSAILRNCFFRLTERKRPVAASNVGVDLDRVAVDDDAYVSDFSIDPDVLQQAVCGLPPEFRVIVVMFYFEDLLYREIAEKLGLPLGTVMSRLARAKRHLRAALAESESVSPRFVHGS
jgi:RNA polymerase sigma-70 factor (ECF subfamily)